MSFPNGHLNMQDKVHHTPGLGLDAGPNKDDPRDIFLRSKGKLHPIWLVVLASACVMHTQKDRYDNWIIKNAFTARTRPLNLHTSEIANLGLRGSQRKIVIENVLCLMWHSSCHMTTAETVWNSIGHGLDLFEK